jgi:hypothetical protein
MGLVYHDIVGAMFSDDLAIRVEAAEPVWQAAAEWPEATRWIGDGVGAALAAGVPVLRDVHPVDHAPYLRPPGHRRAFYLRDPGGPGVLAIKGSEPLATNFGDFLDEVGAARVGIEVRLGSPAIDRTLSRAELSGLDKFPILEGKVPGAVTVREALAEARAALAIQRTHVARHGVPARLSLPVFLGRWPAAVAERVAAELGARMAGRGLELAVAALAGGLAVYVYRYPSVPVRLAHLAVPDARRGADVAGRLAAIARHVEPRAALDGWLGLTARMLALGFVAKDPRAVVSGDCLQVQNACLDGGFADVESVVESRGLDERALRDAVRRTAHELALDATRLLFGLATSTVDLRDRLPDLVAIVWADLAARVEADAPVDPRIVDILRARPDTYAALVRSLELAF